MLSNGIALAALTCAGLYMIYIKLPRKVRLILLKFDLFTDIAALVFTYFMFGGTVTALIAASLVSIAVSVLLHIAKHPDDYVWLHDILKTFSGLMDQFKMFMKDLNTKYVDSQEANTAT